MTAPTDPELTSLIEDTTKFVESTATPNPDFADVLERLPRAEFEQLLAHVVDHVQSDGLPTPDFVEVVTRAHGMDPGVVDSRQVERARLLQASSEPTVNSTTAPDPELDSFLAEVREEGIRASAAHLQRSHAQDVDTIDVVRPSRARRVGATVAVAACLAVAAAMLLWISGSGVGLLQQYSSPTPSAAVRAGTTGGEHHSVQVHKKPSFSHLGEGMTKDEPAPTSAVTKEPEEQPEQQQVTEPAAEVDIAENTPKRSPKRKRVDSNRSVGDALAQLDAAAQEKWRQGDLRRAQQLLRKVVAKGRRGRRVQLAYGDLFTLARQLDGPSGEQSLWRAYLKDFPKGPHADDARAGLCRRAQPAAAADCWRDYIKHHPNGAHRQQAKQALDSPGELP